MTQANADSNIPSQTARSATNPIGLLRQFARQPLSRPTEAPAPAAAPVEHCDLCAAPLAPEHGHLLELATRQVVCSCDPCALLFSAGNAKFRPIPRRGEYWPDFQISDDQWDALGVPIALAFFFQCSTRGHFVTMYPSPGGATEAALPGDVWDLLGNDNPRLAKMRPDVEALLVNRMRGARDYFLAPIDQCYRLVGLIRTHWRGLSGGPRVLAEMDEFFRQLKAASVGGSRHA